MHNIRGIKLTARNEKKKEEKKSKERKKGKEM